MKNLEVNIEIQSVDKVKTMIDLLAKHIDELPAEVFDGLNELADCEACEIDVDWLIKAGFSPEDIEIVINGHVTKRVISINKVLKRVTTSWIDCDGNLQGIGGDLATLYKYPQSLTMRDKKSGTVIVEW